MGCKLAVISAWSKGLHSLQVLIKSPLTFPYPALQNRLQFRYCIGEVTSVTPILLKTGQENIPQATEKMWWQVNRPYWRQMSLQALTSSLESCELICWPWLSSVAISEPCSTVWKAIVLPGTLIHQAAWAIIQATPANLGPGLGDIIRDELR